MSAYIYKVSTKPVGYIGQEPVYPATYGFKPTHYGHDADKENARMAFKSGVVSCEAAWDRMPEGMRHNVLVLSHGNIYRIRYCIGSVNDDSPQGFAQTAEYEEFHMTKRPT